MSVDGGIGLTCQGCTLGVTDAEHLCAALLGVANCHQGVHGFTRLADGNYQGLVINHWVAVAKLVRQLNGGW